MTHPMQSGVTPSGQPTARVVQVGPDLSLAGGMSSVISMLAGLSLPGYEISVVSTYRAHGSRWVRGLWFTTQVFRILTSVFRSDLAHIHVSQGGSFVRKLSVAYIARILGKPVVLSIHGSRFNEWAPGHPRLSRGLLSSATLVLVLTETTRATVRQLCPPAQIRQTVNFVDVPPDAPPPRLDATPTAVFAGEIGRRKGVDILLRAWERVAADLPTAELVLAGDICDHGLTRNLPPGVRLTGRLPRAEMGSLLEMARVVVLPSRREAMPMIVLEAAAAARPVIATPVCDQAGVVSEGGIIVEPEDAVGLADALRSMLSDPHTAAELGERGWQLVRRHHSLEAAAQVMSDVYGQALQVSHGGARR